MCLNPVYKKNPYYGSPDFNHALAHNVEDEYIACPCGHCADCRAVKQSNMIQRVQTESKYKHIFFATLTYDNKHLPVLELEVPKRTAKAASKTPSNVAADQLLFDAAGNAVSEQTILQRLAAARLDSEPDCSDVLEPCDSGIRYELQRDSSGRERMVKILPPSVDDLQLTEETEIIRIPYADIHHLQLMFKRMRDNNTLGRSFTYLAVSERGKQRARPHFHILFFVPRHKGDDFNTCLALEDKLKDMLLRFWSTNVGTRKNPVYERNFTYRQRWIGRKLYRNFDCHYVNPVLTTEGVADVGFYVTKYIFKDSPKEQSLQQMLSCRLEDASYFSSVWDIVKSRYVASKGLGLDGSFETYMKPIYVPESIATLKRVPVVYNPNEPDLPPDAEFRYETVNGYRLDYSRSRKLVPNPEILSLLREHALDEKEKGFAIYVGYNGQHIPLGRYYRERILTEYQRVDLYYSYNPTKYPSKRAADALSKEEIDALERKYQKTVAKIESHEVVDSRWDEIEERGQNIDPYAASYRTAAFLHTLQSSKRLIS